MFGLHARANPKTDDLFDRHRFGVRQQAFFRQKSVNVTSHVWIPASSFIGHGRESLNWAKRWRAAFRTTAGVFCDFLMSRCSQIIVSAKTCVGRVTSGLVRRLAQ